MDDDFFDEDDALDVSLYDEIENEIYRESNTKGTGCFGTILLVLSTISGLIIFAAALVII